MNQTTFATPGTNRQKWYIVDASNLTVGRAASRIALVLQGKNKPEYSPNIDTGDCVVIINADKMKISGNKTDDKVYRYHTLYPGGLKEISYERMQNNHPERIIGYAVRRMLPKTKMGNKMFKKLFIYNGDQHPHGAQSPEELDLNIKRSV
jgi:large subunit ribosomal protein L13